MLGSSSWKLPLLRRAGPMDLFIPKHSVHKRNIFTYMWSGFFR
jgi:hypothetical protein